MQLPVAPDVALTSPAAGATLTTRDVQFSGTASNRAGDATTVVVKVWGGTDTSMEPLQTLNATRSGTSWSVGTATELGDGPYTWRAEQGST